MELSKYGVKDGRKTLEAHQILSVVFKYVASAFRPQSFIQGRRTVNTRKAC